VFNGKFDKQTFLTEYWQKKPLLIKNAFTNFKTPISAEELAGLSLEEEVESRIIIQNATNDYSLKTGPFNENYFQKLPEKNWTLLIQGMDKLIPEVADLIPNFNFIPNWRLDDVMVSYATIGGNVGPHYDNYDVFLLQAQGKRNWQLSSQNCNPGNYIQGLDIRLMESFIVEDDYICEAGDLLYIPPLWGHHGISLTDDCLTFSFGYRSYKGLEVWDSFGDYLAETNSFQSLYQDPSWLDTQAGQITDASWQQAQKLLQSVLDNEQLFKKWFGRFATQLDTNSAERLPEPLSEDEVDNIETIIASLQESDGIQIDPVCRFAYYEDNNKISFYINGTQWTIFNATSEFIKLLCNNKRIDYKTLNHHLNHDANKKLITDLWTLQAFEIM
jgi:50S ribosomal protein L16 3-hydroxylase